eukprot:735398-Prorocentrum_minimum.AAC.2
MSFVFVFDKEEDVYAFAYSYPFTYTHQQKLLAEVPLPAKHRPNDRFHRHGLSATNSRNSLHSTPLHSMSRETLCANPTWIHHPPL